MSQLQATGNVASRRRGPCVARLRAPAGRLACNKPRTTLLRYWTRGGPAATFGDEIFAEFGTETKQYRKLMARCAARGGWVEICAPAKLYGVAVEVDCFTGAAEIDLRQNTSPSKGSAVAGCYLAGPPTSTAPLLRRLFLAPRGRRRGMRQTRSSAQGAAEGGVRRA